ncbi:MAG: MFS transporter [Pseudorhodoplanes sp.]|nr:MFS transporter [Pseudorhodoplanes sp.]
MFMDISSEMIHALLPLYLVTVLGASMVAVGFIEGVAEATAMIVRVFSGTLSDWLGRRKILAAIGYGLAAFTKPIFPLATSLDWIVAACFIDRVGKGIRGAPRDALVADLSPARIRGASFGLRQTLDTVGAFLGPLAAVGLMLASANDFTLVFWIAAVPAFLAFALILFAVKEPARHRATQDNAALMRLADAARLPAAFWMVVGLAALLTLARFSEAFLVLRAQNVGLALAWAPAIMVVMNVMYALSAYPAGAASDWLGRGGLLAAGIAALIAADVVLAYAADGAAVLLGVVFWGLHMGLTQGLLAALVADTAPAALRGTAFGIFNLGGGLALLAASIVAGALWDGYGPRATFLAGAGFAAASMLAVAALWRTRAMSAFRR